MQNDYKATTKTETQTIKRHNANTKRLKTTTWF